MAVRPSIPTHAPGPDRVESGCRVALDVAAEQAKAAESEREEGRICSGRLPGDH